MIWMSFRNRKGELLSDFLKVCTFPNDKAWIDSPPSPPRIEGTANPLALLGSIVVVVCSAKSRLLPRVLVQVKNAIGLFVIDLLRSGSEYL